MKDQFYLYNFNKIYHVCSGVQKNKPRGKLKMAAEAAENLLKECKSIIEKYQAKSMFFKCLQN